MIAFEAEPFALASSKSARMEQRTTSEAKFLIERAARAVGLGASEFTVAAACRAARDTLQQYETTVLRPEAHRAFMDAFDATAPAPALVDIMRLHAEVAAGRT